MRLCLRLPVYLPDCPSIIHHTCLSYVFILRPAVRLVWMRPLNDMHVRRLTEAGHPSAACSIFRECLHSVLSVSTFFCCRNICSHHTHHLQRRIHLCDLNPPPPKAGRTLVTTAKGCMRCNQMRPPYFIWKPHVWMLLCSVHKYVSD